MNRRVACALSGVVVAACALAMLFGPIVLEICGHGAAATPKYTLFIAVANLAGSCVTWLDGLASEIHHLGARGALAADAVLTVLGIGVLLAMIAVTRGSKAQAPSPAA